MTTRRVRKLGAGLWSPRVPRNKVDISGQRFGELTAISSGCYPYWWYGCDHGHRELRDRSTKPTRCRICKAQAAIQTPERRA
jgi:hypothetical protein